MPGNMIYQKGYQKVLFVKKIGHRIGLLDAERQVQCPIDEVAIYQGFIFLLALLKRRYRVGYERAISATGEPLKKGYHTRPSSEMLRGRLLIRVNSVDI